MQLRQGSAEWLNSPCVMRINLLVISGLLLLGSPTDAVAHGDKGYEEQSFSELKAMKLGHLRRMTACVAKASNLEEMRVCRPKRRHMGSQPEA